MRKSQQIIFWRDHKVTEIRIDGKVIGWYGKRFPKTAEDILESSN